jgi:prepilin-type N-terminal cleavage/methylation domain-containing protein
MRVTVQAKHSHSRAFTLVESVVAIAIVGIMISAALAAIGASAGAQKVGIKKRQAVQLGNDLLAEIEQYPYEDPDANPTFGVDAGETSGSRPTYDDVDDYNGYSESPPEDSSGSAYSAYSGWTRQVSVQYVNGTDLGVSATDLGLKKITVTVTDPNGAQTSLYTLRSSYSQREVEPTSETTYVGGVTIELRAGESSGGTIVSSATPLNLIP